MADLESQEPETGRPVSVPFLREYIEWTKGIPKDVMVISVIWDLLLFPLSSLVEILERLRLRREMMKGVSNIRGLVVFGSNDWNKERKISKREIDYWSRFLIAKRVLRGTPEKFTLSDKFFDLFRESMDLLESEGYPLNEDVPGYAGIEMARMLLLPHSPRPLKELITLGDVLGRVLRIEGFV